MDKRTKKQVVILIALLAVLVIVVFIAIRSSAGGTAAAPESDAAAAPAEEPAERTAQEPGRQAEGEGEKPPTVGEVGELLARVHTALEVDVPRTVLDSGSAFLAPEVQGLAQQTPGPREGPGEAPPPQLDMSLTAILWSQEHPLAVINGRVVAEGDVVGTNLWVEQIQPASVTVKYQYQGEDHQKELSLKKR